MPIQRCQSGGKPGFKWGDSGKCYTYNAKDKRSRSRARTRALRQAQAINASK